MKYNLLIHHSGIQAKFLQGMQTAARYDNVTGLYFNCLDQRTRPENGNIFNHVFDQQLTGDFFTVDCWHCYNYTNHNSVENSEYYHKYKMFIRDYIRFNPILQQQVDYWAEEFNINSDTTGIHVRLCDMNIQHGADYGIVTLPDYLLKMDFNTNYFVSSDNQRSLDVMKGIFGNAVNFVPDLIRGQDETTDTSHLQLKNFSNPKFWQESFLEALLLSKCGKLICRTSSVSQSAILLSDTIKQIIRL